eukprot:Rmarinus@m.13458
MVGIQRQSLFTPKGAKSAYVDRSYCRAHNCTKEEYQKRLEESTTLYIGNLSFYTTEEQICELFSKCGEVKRIIMGLDKNKRTPCGFCFVIYYDRDSSQRAVNFISGTKLDDRIIRVDWDAGFQEGRQYGRGRSGGQVRDEFRTDFDSGRGGYGKQATPEKRFFEGGPPDAQMGTLYGAPLQMMMGGGAAAGGGGVPYPKSTPPESRKRPREDDE